MTKELYEFLFSLRGSGFMYNTPENGKKILYEALHHNGGFTFLRDRSSSLYNNQLDGEIGTLSEDNIRNLRNMLISTASVIPLVFADYNIDFEKAHIITDYYINEAESIKNYDGFAKLTESLFSDFLEMMENRSHLRYSQLVLECIHYVDQNLFSALSVASVAKALERSPSYLSSRFQKEVGKSLYTYIQEKKMEEARHILFYTKQPITAIASALCYHSLPHFSAAFKRYYGVSPLQYRNGIEAAHPDP